VTPGENGTEPTGPLVGSADSAEWQQISSDYPVGFAFHCRAVLDDYSGVLASVNGGELLISLDSSSSLLHILTVVLSGESPRMAAIPSAEVPGSLQSIGVSIQSKLLSVIVDCNVIHSVWLAQMPSGMDFSSVESFNPPTHVSWRET
jgi:hypothetical protein